LIFGVLCSAEILQFVQKQTWENMPKQHKFRLWACWQNTARNNVFIRRLSAITQQVLKTDGVEMITSGNVGIA